MDQVGLARMVIAHLEIRPSGIRPSVSKPVHPGGGGGHSPLKWVGGAAGGSKPDPVTNRSVHTKYTLSQYTLLKTSICIPCCNIAHLE